ncbi:amidase [Brevibacterium sp. 50QC2O2]|uniref:amidase n=1 Tax=Brevibacterium sp. 50QC2O2 TaxID=2968459 RepID=UPI00211CEB25|nr:amidase [Brevibacterium sp. 50QC2O2]MCQ9389558.1 amidase [Brevibacterium sp. 50QC2O2]
MSEHTDFTDPTELAYASATELLTAFRAGTTTPAAVLEAQLARIDAHDGSGGTPDGGTDGLGAIVDRYDDEARELAAAATERYRAGTARALEGITVAVKEKHAMAGRHMTEGSLAWDGTVPDFDHPVVERLRAAGAILHVRTATPEFSITGYTQSLAWGVTRNPWNPDFSPGGSSGGSGAALAAGMTTLATASDIGGSTRGPASYCGLLGYKAPYGRVPGAAPNSLDYYRGDGLLARSVEDACVGFNLISGQHWRDQTSLPDVTIRADEPVAGMRIAYSEDLGGFAVDAEVRANTRALLEALSDAGAEVEQVAFPDLRREFATALMVHFGQLNSQLVTRTTAGREDELTEYGRDTVALGRRVAAEHTMYDAVQAEWAIQQALARIMKGFDALVCPTSATVGQPAGVDVNATGIEVGGRQVSGIEALLTAQLNVNNRCPVMSVPSGFASNGVPTGAQIVGRPYADDTVFSLAAAVESLGYVPFTRGVRPEL